MGAEHVLASPSHPCLSGHWSPSQPGSLDPENPQLRPQLSATALKGVASPIPSPASLAQILRFPWGTVTHIVPPCQLGPCCTLIYWPNIPGIVFCSVFCFLAQLLGGLITLL